MNPLTSPWNKHRPVFIQDKMLYFKWAAIEKHLVTQPNVQEYTGTITINKQIYLAKKATKFRLKSHLDWAWYTPKTLAHAIDTDTVEQYYEIMLTDQRSDPNIWPDSEFEMTLKSFYAARVNRCSQLEG